MTTTMETIDPMTDNTNFVAPEAFSKPMSMELCCVSALIRRPSMRPMIRNAKMIVAIDKSTSAEVDKDHRTSGNYICDIHPLWKLLDGNEREIRARIEATSISDKESGLRLVPLRRLGPLLNTLVGLRDIRKELASRMRKVWDTEVIPGIKAEFPQHHHIFLHTLPTGERIADQLDVKWTVQLLTQPSPEQMGAMLMSHEEASTAIAACREQFQARVRGVVSTFTEEIAQRSLSLIEHITGTRLDEQQRTRLEGGNRKQGTITEITGMLERLQNFDQFIQPELLEKIRAASKMMSEYTITDINKQQSARDRIQAAFAPIEQDLRQLIDHATGFEHDRPIHL